MFPRRKVAPETVYSISSASQSLADNQKARSRRYMWSMGIRMACFGIGIVVEGFWRWFFIAGSLILPWVAVVIANAGLESRRVRGETFNATSGKELE